MPGPIEQTTAWKGKQSPRLNTRPNPQMYTHTTHTPTTPSPIPALESHAERVKRVHLRDLLQDASRNSALSVSANGILFDYSRQNATTEVGKGVTG